MRRFLVLFVLALAFANRAAAAEYAVRGMVVSVNRPAKAFTASIDEIKGYMRAMTMPFDVRQAAELDGMTPGAIVEFTLVVERQTSFARQIRVVKYQNLEQDPFTASRLKLLNDVIAGNAATKALAVGEVVPDFSLTDQR